MKSFLNQIALLKCNSWAKQRPRRGGDGGWDVVLLVYYEVTYLDSEVSVDIVAQCCLFAFTLLKKLLSCMDKFPFHTHFFFYTRFQMCAEQTIVYFSVFYTISLCQYGCSNFCLKRSLNFI